MVFEQNIFWQTLHLMFRGWAMKIVRKRIVSLHVLSLYNHHILKSFLELRVPATLFLTIACMSLLSLQIPATIFLMTSSQCRSPFLQNIQLFNLHQSPSNLICQGRRRRPALAFLQNEHLQTSQPSTPMPSTSTAPTPR